MKTCIIQPAYSLDYAMSEQLFRWELEALDQCDESMDLIVLPEACDVPCLARDREQYAASYTRYRAALLEKCADTARRCGAVIFVNATFAAEKGIRNTTYAFDTKGQIVGHYFKQHLTPGEVNKRKLDSEYTFEHSVPTVLTIDGVRYAFLTCYDFYFYEAFANIARQNVDVIIGCSHQRSDTQEAIAVMSRFCAYNCNAYMVRASVSMDENSHIGGGSMIVAPDGRVLVDMKSRVGMECAEFDPKQKYYKPAGFGNPPAAHYTYIEAGRRPWKYRPAGPSMIAHDEWLPYPRICAHRGFSTVAPENSMSAYGAAVAMGAEEIEFDLWWTRDGQIVSAHDGSLERVSNGTGNIYDYTLEQLRELDFGSKFGEAYTGMKILTFEEILKKFTCQVVMNVHLKTRNTEEEYDPQILRKIIELIDRYDCRKWVYFMCGNDNVLRLCQQMAPDIVRCVGGGKDPWHMVERAIKYDCKKIQLVKNRFDQEMIDRAHANGIVCNVYWSDDPAETQEFLDMGIDTILTNDCHRIAQVVGKKEKYRR